MGISEQSTILCEQKLLTSRQIFRYAVPARTVTKKALDVASASYQRIKYRHVVSALTRLEAWSCSVRNLQTSSNFTPLILRRLKVLLIHDIVCRRRKSDLTSTFVYRRQNTQPIRLIYSKDRLHWISSWW